MKKAVLALLVAGTATTANAQQKNVQSALGSLRNKEYKEAIEYVDLAIKDPSTQSSPKAWAARGQIYSTMDQLPEYKDKGYYKDAAASYIKVVELKSNYEPEEVNSALLYSAYKGYNETITAYNAKKYSDAYEAAKMTKDIRNIEGGKRFAANKSLDTLAANAALLQAYSAFYNNESDKALPILEELKANPIVGNDANTYLIIIDVYKKKGDDVKELATIEEGKKRFPSNTSIRNEELNYYIRTKQQDKLIAKLEDAVKTEPNNPVYQYNLANAYTNVAFAKEGGKPANYVELIGKAEAGFEKALSLDPDNMGYHFDIGVLFFNQASTITEQMNDVPTNDDKKYNELKAQRDDKFAKALPHLEKIQTTYESKYNSLDADNKAMYRSSVQAMKEIYARQNKLDKSAEMKAKYDAAK